VTVEEALELYTVAGAFATFEEREKGKLQPGMLADLTVLQHDPRTVDPLSLAQLPVTRTVIGGKTVYEA
jgi:predicted amidohydrolase YtcJ